jgi:hypothetical protein
MGEWFFRRSVSRVLVFSGRVFIIMKAVYGTYGGNMFYKVKAKVIDEKIGEFYCKLADGTVGQRIRREFKAHLCGPTWPPAPRLDTPNGLQIC